MSNDQTEPPAAGTVQAPSCTLVIFGAGGDLTKRLLMPAIYNLSCGRLLPDDFKVLGIDRGDDSDDAWRSALTETMRSFTKDKTAEFYTPSLEGRREHDAEHSERDLEPSGNERRHDSIESTSPPSKMAMRPQRTIRRVCESDKECLPMELPVPIGRGGDSRSGHRGIGMTRAPRARVRTD